MESRFTASLSSELRADQDRVMVTLHKGENTVLLRQDARKKAGISFSRGRSLRNAAQRWPDHHTGVTHRSIVLACGVRFRIQDLRFDRTAQTNRFDWSDMFDLKSKS